MTGDDDYDEDGHDYSTTNQPVMFISTAYRARSRHITPVTAVVVVRGQNAIECDH